MSLRRHEDTQRAIERIAAELTAQPCDREGNPDNEYRDEEHGVARQTAAKALKLLEAEGLTFRVPGLGYYVKKPGSRKG
jgi:hypothetical protein